MRGCDGRVSYLLLLLLLLLLLPPVRVHLLEIHVRLFHLAID